MAKKQKSVYIQTQGGEKFYFDAVLEVTYQQTGTASEYAVESGVNVTDHYTQGNDSLNINGSISAVKFSSYGDESTSLEDFERGLTSLKKNGELFSVSFSDNLEVLKNCLFNSLDFKRSTSTGRYSMDVSASIKQVIVASRASIVATPTAAVQYLDVVTEKEKSSGNSIETTEQQLIKIKQLREKLREDDGIFETGTGLEDLII